MKTLAMTIKKQLKNALRAIEELQLQLKEKNTEIARLRKQLANNHNIKCTCSFCWSVPNE